MAARLFATQGENVPVSRPWNRTERKVRPPPSFLPPPPILQDRRCLLDITWHRAPLTGCPGVSLFRDACPLSLLQHRGRLPQVGGGRTPGCGRCTARCLVWEQERSCGWLVSPQWCPSLLTAFSAESRRLLPGSYLGPGAHGCKSRRLTPAWFLGASHSPEALFKSSAVSSGSR